jgi:CHAT domain-containing protein
VLVTAPSAGGDDYRSAAWLARRNAITVLPAVSSLKALRRVARPSAATKPIIGFGNPLLDGDQNHTQYGAYYRRAAALARDTQRCTEQALPRVAMLRKARSGVRSVTARGDGFAELAHLGSQTPLPETADELCAVARHLNARPGDTHLGASATERAVKAMSQAGTLAQHRILHFATHGTLAGQLSGTTEPGLILTPPDVATKEDDGYLSASEITSLKLDADWVILSACNTAAGGAAEAEALSGLARAFFYAQARALLVSHWAVDSDATVKLITGTVAAMTRNAGVGRAEALRRAMLALVDDGKAKEAHPSYWAPFVLVGEGAAPR